MHPNGYRDSYESIGSSDEIKPAFRELTAEELIRQHSFSDTFRTSFTLRCDRDKALAFARKVEALAAQEFGQDARVYVGVRNA